MDKWIAEKKADTGRFYKMMIDHVKQVLADPKRVVPGYDPAQGYELAGFVWFQGFNDLVDGHVYPDRSKPGRYDRYSEWLAHFIRDVRRDLGVPKMPFVIGVLGVDGANANKDTLEFRRAMAAPAALPEFAGNVVAIETAPFWSEELGAIDRKREKVSQMRHYLDSKHKNHANADGKMTDEEKRAYVKKYEAEVLTPAEITAWKRGASNAGYHYLGCAKTFALMGQAFAEANLKLMKAQEGK
jgi:alpha-galactosidase